MESYKTIGERIAALRKQANLTQKELAQRLTISRELVNFWENDLRMIKGDDIVRLADALDTTCDYLLRGVSTVNLSVYKDTGLNDDAINFLREAKDSITYRSTVALLNVLLENRKQFIQLCFAMLDYADTAPATVVINRNYGEASKATSTYRGDSADPLLKYVAQERFSEILDFLRNHNKEATGNGQH